MRALAIVALLAGCSSVELEPTTSKVIAGPAMGQPIRKVVAVRASCASLSTFSRRRGPNGQWVDSPTNASGCSEEQIDGVDQLVRLALEFRGYAVVDSERVNAVTARRTDVLVVETEQRDDERLTSTRSTESVVTGSLFADAPPAVQDQILAELDAEGLLHARILVGAPVARSPRRSIDVQVRLVDVASGDLVWASRCRINVGWEVNEPAVMKAARCATDKIAARPR